MSAPDSDKSTLDIPCPVSIVRGRVVPGGSDLLPVLTLLYHPWLGRIGERAVLPQLAAGAAVHLSRLDPAFAPPRGSAGRGAAEPLGDAHLSRKPIRLLRLGDGRLRIDARDTPLRLSVQGEPVEESRDFPWDEVRAGLVLELAGRAVLMLHEAEADAEPGETDEDLGLVGASDAIERVRRVVRRLADLDVPVLVRGETGSGKELVARALHHAGLRRGRPFVAVNMGAVPPALAAVELFGAERGAFTGAAGSRAGYFGAAEDGTLFLDEIGETAADVQALLLRALDTGEIQPVGSARTRQVRVRVVAATDADLDAKVRSGTFRAPLLHRLASYELSIPPLRERRDDIARLLLHFLRAELERLGEAHRLDAPWAGGKPWLPASLVIALTRCAWPGNVRQLRNVVRQLVIGSRGSRSLEPGPELALLLSVAPPTASAAPPPPVLDADPAPARSGGPRRKPRHVSEAELLDALRTCRWDFKLTAERLRISRTSLYGLVEACSKVRRASDLDPEDIARCYRECEGDVAQMASRLEVSRYALSRRIRELRIGRDDTSTPAP